MKNLFVLFLCLAFTSTLLSQNKLKYLEFGAGVGSLNYNGDIATTMGVSSILSEVRPNFKVYGLKHFNDWFAMGAQASYGWFYASDLNHGSPTRGFEVQTDVTQVNALIEANLIRYGKYHYKRKFGMYVQAGGGFFAYNPQIFFENLEPEGVTLYPNSYSGMHFFFTGGLKFRTSYKSTIRLEAYFHTTQTDHLDGFIYTDMVSKNDSFMGVAINYSVLVF